MLGVGVDDQIRLTSARDPFTVTAIVADTAEASLTNPQSLIIPFVYASCTAGETLFNRKADIFTCNCRKTPMFPLWKTFRADFPRHPYANNRRCARNLPADRRFADPPDDDDGSRVAADRRHRHCQHDGRRRAPSCAGNRCTQNHWLAGTPDHDDVHARSVAARYFGQFSGRPARHRPDRPAAFGRRTIGVAYAAVHHLAAGHRLRHDFGRGDYARLWLFADAVGCRVRPNVVLNPTDDSPIPPAGKLQTVLILGILTVIMGLVVGNIIGNYLVGVGATLGVVIALGVVLLGLWVLVLILSIVPSFGSIRLKLAQRAIGTQRVRTASTLLALIIGMGGLSVLLLFTQSVLNLIDTTFEQAVGGNILVVPQSYETTLQAQEMLADLPGIVDTQLQATYSAEIVAISGNTDMEALTAAARAIGEAQYNPDDDTSTQVQAGAGQGDGQGFDPSDSNSASWPNS